MPKLLQVTLGAGATQISATSILCREIVFQNNGATNDMRVGDSTVSSTKGIKLLKASGSLTVGPLTENSEDLRDWYVFGTAADVIDILYM